MRIIFQHMPITWLNLRKICNKKTRRILFYLLLSYITELYKFLIVTLGGEGLKEIS